MDKGWKLVSGFRNNPGYKVNIKKSTMFLYTGNPHIETDILKTP